MLVIIAKYCGLQENFIFFVCLCALCNFQFFYKNFYNQKQKYVDRANEEGKKKKNSHIGG